ncbi:MULTISPECIES: hypothetical protein [Pseudomonas]|uniref:hypothetical protein n=1 Tax=Pseudomonas TaxID=286 RepID=UPI0018E8D4AC|nr:hypothetical protein [Pseudomonas sp. MF7453]MBJ2219505.1 hypothetical protein [Pseudomonas sp. MF7453]
MNINNGMAIKFPYDLILPEAGVSIVAAASLNLYNQYSGWNDLRLSKQLAGDFKMFEDPKNPGFITLSRLEELSKECTDVGQFAKELLKRESLLDKLDSDGDKWLDGKISPQSIQDTIAELTQLRKNSQVKVSVISGVAPLVEVTPAVVATVGPL